MKTEAIFVLLLTLTLSCGLMSQPKVFTCIDEKGDKLFTFEAHSVWQYSDGYAMFKTTVLDEPNNQMVWRVGFLDSLGNIAIEPIYDGTYTTYYGFKYGVSWVRRPGEEFYVLINKKGEVISEKSYEKVGSFNDSVCDVYEGYNMGFVDVNGKEVIPCKYFGDTWFYDGLVCVCPVESTDELYGFLNKKGEIAIPFKFKQPGHSGFSNGEARVVINGKTCLINTKGEVVFTPVQTNNIDNFCDGLAMAYTKPDRSGFGFVNRQNKWVIQPIYDYASEFENGRTVVEKAGKKGVIDTLGRYIIPIKYDEIYGDCGSHGLFWAVIGEESFFFNCDGKAFTSAEDVQHIGGREDEKFHPYRNSREKMGYLNIDGSIFIEAKWENAEAFSEGKAWVY